ncbi:unnamed protein product [Allacma fusca]|uniref:Uncharacterized protein n=1 Tax=Allacma fusca TaxID=39272 RepID=A0A8J2K2N3_9HEXA|nr:unnamed protein product [Allacma fusca]
MLKAVVILFLGLVSLGQCAPSNSSTQATFRNPILNGAAPDPYIYRHNDGFYYWAKSTGNGIEVMRSRILTDFRNSERRVVFNAQAPYGALWAPEIHFIQGNFYIYFALETNNDNANHRMYVIRANDPNNALGGYSGIVKLTPHDSDVWAIDGTVMQYGNGRLYFIWSGWPTINAGFPQNLYIAPMSDPMTLSGPRVLLREPTGRWETIGAPLDEGPQVLEHNGRTFLIFSASGSWTADYCLGMIGIDGLRDPLVRSNWWQDVDRAVFWRNDEQSVFGTGHASFTVSPDGSEPWIVYHAMERPDAGWEGRTARVERFVWNPDGSPGFPRPAGLWNDLETPRGQ